jgi:RimJ/RimL family protein N-acetyltransferase
LTPLDDREVMELHLRALFTHDARDRLVRVNEPGGGGEAPRFVLGRTRVGNLWRFRADLPRSLINEIEPLCMDEPAEMDSAPRHFESYQRLLAPVRTVWMGPAYRFSEFLEPSRPLLAITDRNADKLRGGFESLIAEPPAWQPFLALVEGDRIVSVCRSVRITPEAHEAGVETHPEFRGRGYASEVVAGWAHRVRSLGATPLYSTSWENPSSREVARKLRLVLFGTDFQVG